MDREELIDRFIKADEQKEKGMWETCWLAWELFDQFGMYSHDTCAVLKQERGMDYDVIYNRRDAWAELRTLYGDVKFPDDIRLTASHFYRLHHLRKKVDIEDKLARGYIETAEEYKWSSEELVDTIKKFHDGNPVKTFMIKTAKFVRHFQRVFEESEQLGELGFPQDIMKDLYSIFARVETWLEAKKNEPENSG